MRSYGNYLTLWLHSQCEHQVQLTVKLSFVGFCEEPSNSVSRDGKRDSCRHFEGVYADDVSILSKTDGRGVTS